MAKKKATTKKKKKPIKTSTTPSPERIKKAAAIVAHVLTHFGAGWGSQRQTENPAAAPVNLSIYTTPADASGFHAKLLKSTIAGLADNDLPFSSSQGLRDQVCQAAFNHGVEARKLAVSDGTPTVNLAQILKTHLLIKATCPGSKRSAGGGRVCNF